MSMSFERLIEEIDKEDADFQIMVEILKRDPSLVSRKDEEQGLTPILLAALRGEIDIVDFLMEWGAKLTEKTSTGQTALMLAANFSDYDLAARAIQNGVDPFAVDKEGHDALYYAKESKRRAKKELKDLEKISASSFSFSFSNSSFFDNGSGSDSDFSYDSGSGSDSELEAEAEAEEKYKKECTDKLNRTIKVCDKIITYLEKKSKEREEAKNQVEYLEWLQDRLVLDLEYSMKEWFKLRDVLKLSITSQENKGMGDVEMSYGEKVDSKAFLKMSIDIITCPEEMMAFGLKQINANIRKKRKLSVDFVKEDFAVYALLLANKKLLETRLMQDELRINQLVEKMTRDIESLRNIYTNLMPVSDDMRQKMKQSIQSVLIENPAHADGNPRSKKKARLDSTARDNERAEELKAQKAQEEAEAVEDEVVRTVERKDVAEIGERSSSGNNVAGGDSVESRTTPSPKMPGPILHHFKSVNIISNNGNANSNTNSSLGKGTSSLGKGTKRKRD